MAEWTARHKVRLTHLTDNPVGRYDDDPVLSPTGELVAFGRSDGEGGQWIMTMRPDGTDVRQIAGGLRPRWSPDGSQIVYMNEPAVCDEDGRCVPRISVINSDGTDPHAIGAGGKPEWGPACTITGTEGDDEITGTVGRDFICAGAGNDLVLASGGNDTVFGGRGRDRLIGDSGDDILMGESGGDHLLGGPGRDAIGAADLVKRNDTTAGGPDADICYLDTKYHSFPRDCEVVRSVYPE